MVSTFSSVSSKRRRARGAHALDEVCRTDVQPCTKQAAQRSLRDSGLCCQSVGPPIGERMRGCSLRELLNFAVADRLRGQLRGELALATRSNTKDDVPSGNRESDLSAKIDLDHRKRQIHSGGHACRRPDAAILYMDRITFNEHR